MRKIKKEKVNTKTRDHFHLNPVSVASIAPESLHTEMCYGLDTYDCVSIRLAICS